MIRLNRELQEQIVAGIRAGAFPQVAAQAFGVSRRSFLRWRRLGRSNEGDTEFVAFASAVDQAAAQARLRAEMGVFTEQPRIWLQHGPGRETSECPGWTVAIKPTSKAKVASNAFAMPEVQELIDIVLGALEGQPDVQADIADQVARLRIEKK